VAVLTFVQLTALWKNAGGDPLQAETAAAIALAESGGNTNAINNSAYPNRPGYHTPVAGAQKEYSVGLWQINLLAHPSYTAAQMLTALGNVRAAIAISGNGGNWHPWSTYTSGAYRAYLPKTVPTPAPGPGAPAPAGKDTATRATAGYYHLQQALSRALPQALSDAQRIDRQTLRRLSSGRKVG
jgi:hypothetical protein